MKKKYRFIVTYQRTGFSHPWSCHTCNKKQKVSFDNSYEWQVTDRTYEHPDWWFCSDECVNMYILSKI